MAIVWSERGRVFLIKENLKINKKQILSSSLEKSNENRANYALGFLILYYQRSSMTGIIKLYLNCSSTSLWRFLDPPFVKESNETLLGLENALHGKFKYFKY